MSQRAPGAPAHPAGRSGAGSGAVSGPPGHAGPAGAEIPARFRLRRHRRPGQLRGGAAGSVACTGHPHGAGRLSHRRAACHALTRQEETVPARVPTPSLFSVYPSEASGGQA
ncbi:hypothetical protein G6F40_017796 [Rhizopus arrhizus]|nr:hypothetical protein G6F40_017796 [Rhizopus arrhizus]